MIERLLRNIKISFCFKSIVNIFILLSLDEEMG